MRQVSRRHLTFGALVMGAALLVPAPEARADGPVTAEVLIIHATQGTPSVDPAIGEMPPLKYNNYKLLERKVLPLSKGQASSTGLPTGRTFQLVLGDVTPDKRYKISASISQPDGKAFLKLLEITAQPNKRFFVGGQTYQGGSLVIGVRILAQ
mgnify:CR=1 FL=1